MSKKTDATKAREIIEEAEKTVSTWPEWKLRQFEQLSEGDCQKDCRSRDDQDNVTVSL
jgi:hypothetical protein